MDKQTICQQCNHFRQHWTERKGRLFMTKWGHCPRFMEKTIRTLQPACIKFSLRDMPQEEKTRNQKFRDDVLEMQKRLTEILKILSARDQAD